MAENSKIEWTHHTFNPWVGCRQISVGPQGACVHCYAEAWAKRAGRDVWGDSPRQRTSVDNWKQPLRWDARLSQGERARVFCASLADVFDNDVPEQWRTDLFRLIWQTPNLDWLLLSKRVGNASRMITDSCLQRPAGIPPMPWPNVWLGATVVTQEEAERDIPKLLAVPAAIRFLSVEPMMGPLDLSFIDFLPGTPPWPDWVICGGESGPRARPMDRAWADDLSRQCRDAGVAFFMKQGSQANWPDFKNFENFPPSLRVREFPVMQEHSPLGVGPW